MQPIIAPIDSRSTKSTINNLQDTLQTFLNKNIYRDRLNEGEAREYLEHLQPERLASKYGDITEKLVGIFQERYRLEVRQFGLVDTITAEAMNQILKELGLLAEQPTPTQYLVAGTIKSETTSVKGLTIRAFHEAENLKIRLGEDTTDAEGRYTIRYTPLYGIDSIQLKIAVLDNTDTFKESDIIVNAKHLEVIDLTISLAEQPIPRNRISGYVLFEDGHPAEKQELRLYSRKFGAEPSLIAEAETQELGKYSFEYPTDKSTVSIEIRALQKPENQEIPLSKSIVDISAQMELNLVAPNLLRNAESEYDRLAKDLIPHIGNMGKLVGIKENAEQRDLTYLHRASGWDARAIALAAKSEQLAKDPDIKLSPHIIYGLLRAGLPHDKSYLIQIDPQTLKQSLNSVRDAGIVRLNDDEINIAIKNFTTARQKIHLAENIPGSRATLDALLKTTKLDKNKQKIFAALVLDHVGSSEELWNKVMDTKEFDHQQIKDLKLHGKLAMLSNNNEKLTNALMERNLNSPQDLIEQGFYDAEPWITEVLTQAKVPLQNRAQLTEQDKANLDALLPPGHEGEKLEDRLSAYTEGMARKLRISYPMQVLAHRTENDEHFRPLAKSPTTTKLLRAAIPLGFQLGHTPVDAFFNQHQTLLSELTKSDATEAKNEIKTLFRLYQISPSDQALSTLAAMGVTSAHDVMDMEKGNFLEKFKSHYFQLHGKQASNGEGEWSYGKANQISSIVYSMNITARKMQSDFHIAAISPTTEMRTQLTNSLVKQFPTMESLFGSLDYCECEHCRSVLSPAAYFVDLLQSLEKWGKRESYPVGFAKPFDALIKKRPDLPYISLTCENTHTSLPYIDIANEILEFYVANDNKLKPGAAKDTGKVISADLLAEPQNIIPRAYKFLNKEETLYPLNLPFDLWIETTRQFCNYFETPLYQLMESLRPNDKLFASDQTFDGFSILMESLNLSPQEIRLYTQTDMLDTWKSYYGYSEIEDSPTFDAEDTLKSAKQLSRRLGVTYKEVNEIVLCGFVNPALSSLGLLYKLGISISSVRLYKVQKQFYLDNKLFLGKKRDDFNGPLKQKYDDLSKIQDGSFLTGWKILLELNALEDQLDAITPAVYPKEELVAHIESMPLSQVLVLAESKAGCNFDHTHLQFADTRPVRPIDLLRINLFVRLWRKLGWKIDEVDCALCTFIPAEISLGNDGKALALWFKSALIQIAYLNKLEQQLNIGKQSRVKLLTFWKDMATSGSNPLFVQLFQTEGVLKNDPVFYNPLGNQLGQDWISRLSTLHNFHVEISGVKEEDQLNPPIFAGMPIKVHYDPFTETQHATIYGVFKNGVKEDIQSKLPGSKILEKLLDQAETQGNDYSRIRGHLSVLQGAFGLSAKDIEVVCGLDTYLSISTISNIYRHGLLAKALGLSINELITLKGLSGINPFAPINPVTPIDETNQQVATNETLKFIQLVDELKTSGIKITNLDYWLRHNPDSPLAPNKSAQENLAFIKSLLDGIHAIQVEHRLPDSSLLITEEQLQHKLGLILPTKIVSNFISAMKGTLEFTAIKLAEHEHKLPEALVFEDYRIARTQYHAKNEQMLVVRGIKLNDTFQDLLDTNKANLSVEQKSLLTRLLEDIRIQAKQVNETLNNHLLIEAVDEENRFGILKKEDLYELIQPLPPLLQNADVEIQKQKNLEIIQTRFYKIATLLLPVLRVRLIRQFIGQTLATQLDADPELLDRLLTDRNLLGKEASLLNAFTPDISQGVTACFYKGAELKDIIGTPQTCTDVDTSLKMNTNGEWKPILPVNANSASFEGYLVVPVSGPYRFVIELGDGQPDVKLFFPHLPNPLLLSTPALNNNPNKLGLQTNGYLDLKAGIPYRFSLHINNLAGSQIGLRVLSETLSLGPLSQLALYPAAVFDSVSQSVLRLTKSLSLLQGLNVDEAEIRFLQAKAGLFDGLDLHSLPVSKEQFITEDKEKIEHRFIWFRRLLGFSTLKRELADTDHRILNTFKQNTTINKDERDKNTFIALATLFNRKPIELKAVAYALFGSSATFADTGFFVDERRLLSLWKALQVVERYRLPVSTLLDWTRITIASIDNDLRYEIARNVRESIKARFEPEAWQRIAKPIFDKLRQRQRDALTTWIMYKQNFDRIEQLYDYFLIDPGMEPVVQTSRIRLAIASVQLFIQRVLLNLEPNVHPTAVYNKHWEWMKRYRVWEANRKTFLYPENWLEPEFRDDKTHLFTELEGALLQGDVSSDLVEDAFFNYLKKLDELARLDMVAMHIEEVDAAQRILHVFGRTFSQPYKYFYRRYANRMWTPWEPVTADISGDHLAPVVWRDRLYLFWVTFMDKPVQPKIDSANENTELATAKIGNLVGTLSNSAQQKKIDMQLHWSEYSNGEWSHTLTSGFVDDLKGVGFISKNTNNFSFEYDNKHIFIHVSKENNGNLKDGGVFIHLNGYGDFNRLYYVASRTSRITVHINENGNEEKKNSIDIPDSVFHGGIENLATRYSLNHTKSLSSSFRSRVSNIESTDRIVRPILEGAKNRFVILPSNNTLTQFGPDKDATADAQIPVEVQAAISASFDEIRALVKPVFYQDTHHTLFLEPSVAETTLDRWDNWIPQKSKNNPPVIKLPNIKDLIPKAQWPKKIAVDEIKFATDGHAKFKVNIADDPVINHSSFLFVDDELIGSTGRPEINVSIEPSTFSGDTIAITEEVLAGIDVQQVEGKINVIGKQGLTETHLNRLSHSLSLQKIIKPRF